MLPLAFSPSLAASAWVQSFPKAVYRTSVVHRSDGHSAAQKLMRCGENWMKRDGVASTGLRDYWHIAHTVYPRS
jgi:hypothetical protein